MAEVADAAVPSVAFLATECQSSLTPRRSPGVSHGPDSCENPMTAAEQAECLAGEG